MDPRSGPSSSHDSEIQSENLSERVRQLENIASHSFGVITDMIPPNECKFLTQQTSSSVVDIRSWVVPKTKGGKKNVGGDGNNRTMSCCTGFIIDSTSSTLILACASFLLPLFETGENTPIERMKRKATIEVKFFDGNLSYSDLVYIDFSHNIVILRVSNVTGKPYLRFFNKEDDLEDMLNGMTIYTVSHPQCHDTIHPFTFTSGMTSQSCAPVPQFGLARDCHCIMYSLAVSCGSAGAPVLSRTGEVIAMHSNFYNAFGFGIGLKSVKEAFIRHFNLLSENYKNRTINYILDYVLGRV